ncbi:PhzF family phenazine biosynthesis protein [Blastomonas fulva]|uniref:PhzF family phenazine biosynthesis protein n=1 Tax=Blastomonas fulva TaxID=1550728 RepID=UPI0025A43259|nr:PhzF family phenazine biosynthesis protein [Blastomonas fulva]MDM7928945.1 PhzF family phenazine biosynthesis protein [Blastomonas fulva]MDM7965864.1 PhzF family phenazine biosynthesis protein [Blastomonas fulva]
MTQSPATLPYCHIDAFADQPFTGNQAAVMPLDAWLDDAVLQAIGEENNFAETAFIVLSDSEDADYELRWFTPAVEIAMCGHATLASGHYAFENGFAGDTVRFATRKAGVLVVTRDGDRLALSLPAYAPSPAPLPDWTSALGALPAEYHVYPGDYHVLLFDHADDVVALAPDMKALAALGDHQFICTAPGKDTDVLSRVFVPGAGVDEDSVTGSAHAVLTPFWAARLGRSSFTAFQASKRGGLLHCTLDSDRAVLGGHCVTVVTGTFRLR